MRLGFISDLHINQIPMEEDTFMELFRSWIVAKGLTHFFIGGDISNHWKKSCQFVETLQELSGIPVYFIPGNHDYWWQEAYEAGGRDHIDSWIVYRSLAKHPQCLLEKNLKLSHDLVVVGHSGWYNHAYHGRHQDGRDFTEAELEAGVYNGRTWQDKRFVNWGMTDAEASHLMADRVKEQLDVVEFEYGGEGHENLDRGVSTTDKNAVAMLESDNNAPANNWSIDAESDLDYTNLTKDSLNIILMTHMVTIPEFCVPMPHQEFDFFNAFIATNDFDPLLKDYPIRYNFMGHVHYRGEIPADSNSKVTYVVNCLGNVNEWRSDDLLTELNDAIYILDIEI